MKHEKFVRREATLVQGDGSGHFPRTYSYGVSGLNVLIEATTLVQ